MPDEILGTTVTPDALPVFTKEQIDAGYCIQQVNTVEGPVFIVACPADGSARETGKVEVVDGAFQQIESAVEADTTV